MYDGKYIIPGLIVFVALMTFPIWKNMGNAGPVPKPEKPKGVTKCVESVQFMRTSHMKVLNDWRDEVLRDAVRRLNKGVDSREVIEYATASLMKKLLHQPSVRLRAAGEAEEQAIIDAARSLFDIDDKEKS